MKKLLGIIAIALFGVAFSACATTNSQVTLSSEQSLVTMAYLSSGMLSNSTVSTTGLSQKLAEDELEVEEELETVNQYLDLLKGFMENGATGFANITEKESDRVEYTYMIDIVIASETYLLYYNVDQTTDEITGIFVIDEEEYQITAYNDLEDKDEFEDEDEEEFEEEDDDEEELEEDELDEDEDMSFTKLSDVTTEENDSDDEDDEESEKKMTLIATNGENQIEMTYKVETENDETETKFEMESNINGVEKETSIEIKIEDNEYKIEIQDGDNQYEFKREVESEGIEYKLEYEVDGVEGEIKVTETTNELGETVYIYEIEEEGKEKEVEIEEEDDDDLEEETTETNFLL